MPFLAFLEAILLIAPSKQVMQASLGFWIPRRRFRITGLTGFQS